MFLNKVEKNDIDYDVEDLVKKSFQIEEILWTGRAATAFYYCLISILKLKKIHNPEIILPSFSCTTLSMVCQILNFKPIFVDVDLNDGLMNLEEAYSKITKKTVGIVFIHLFGNSTELIEFKKIINKKNIFLIEDITHSLGGKSNEGNLIGHIGDFTIASFNKPKILNCGGGFLIIKDKSNFPFNQKDIFESNNENLLNLKDEFQHKLLSESYRNFHHSVVSLLRNKNIKNSTANNIFKIVKSNYYPIYFKDNFNPHNFRKQFNSLDAMTKQRIKFKNLYFELLENKFQILSSRDENHTCWRFSIILPESKYLFEISEKIRQDGFHVSNLYWPCNSFFEKENNCQNSKFLSERIINFWCDDSIDENYITRCCESLLKNSKMYD